MCSEIKMENIQFCVWQWPSLLLAGGVVSVLRGLSSCLCPSPASLQRPVPYSDCPLSLVPSGPTRPAQ